MSASESVDVLWDQEAPEEVTLIQQVEAWSLALLEAVGASHRTLSVVLTDDTSIQALNRQWREIDAPTDVLSFPMDEGETPTHLHLPAPLGDIVISVETAARQAPAHDYRFEDEVRFLLVHGLCHLLGHDHAEAEEAARMRQEEARLLETLCSGQRRPETPY